mmetsp:Transcript_13411/g.18733  ORF Transcript_13411/g.18733 Transcript_13411/m.18733 type:complete len:82 (+) Transcript_13411:135-380(+)
MKVGQTRVVKMMTTIHFANLKEVVMVSPTIVASAVWMQDALTVSHDEHHTAIASACVESVFMRCVQWRTISEVRTTKCGVQ